MKRLSITMVAACLLFACNNKKTDETSGKTEDKKESTAVTYPYKAVYSSDFSMGDANNAKTVLELYKMWEDGRVDDFKSLMADSVSINFPDGNKFKDNTVDSLISFAKQARKMQSSVSLVFDAWMPIHVNDKNEDYVLVWYREYETNLKGNMDSTRGHAYFQMKNGKVRSWSEFDQKMAPPPPPKK
ncbi:MAG TPA: hypothetical protein VET23_05890 [Chitinophagaceae bacterium]|nr:hypothetical protein [Chitinophagaceae bacterium]